jgi:glucokinase
MMNGVRVIGDIGGTNARFALAEHGRYAELRQMRVADYPTILDALRDYLHRLPDGRRPTGGALAIAGPVGGDEVKLTNWTWSFSIAKLRAALGLAQLVVVNDFAATALAVPHLQEGERYLIGPARLDAAGPIGVIGPGTGLGVSTLVPAAGSWILLPGEGGHATMPAASDEESRILDRLRARIEHVSAERVLSGAGLVNLYEALSVLAGKTAAPLTPAQVTERAMAASDAECVRAFDTFCAMLGTVAGNLALTVGATGGIYLAGGILPRFKEALAASGFRARFEAKGRLADYLRPIPTWLVLHEEPALLGLANLPIEAA